jgi:hypothetical protein
MSELAIDKFRTKGLAPPLEARAQRIAHELAGSGSAEPSFLLGWLTASVAKDLEHSRWRSRDRLAVDLRIVDILRAKR